MRTHDNKVITNVVTCVIFFIGLPLTLGAIYAHYCQVRKDHVAPIYVINLLISNIIQLCCWTILLTPLMDIMIPVIVLIVCLSALAVSVCFRVCIALERYLVIAHPQWNCLRRSVKSSVVVCVLVWTLPLAIVLPVLFLVYFNVTQLILGVFFFLPLPLFIFFLGGTLKALSSSVLVPSDEKRQTVGLLILLLFSYMLLLMPSVILSVALRDTLYVSFMLLQFSPLADLFLYFFMSKGATDVKEGNKQYKQAEM